MGKIIVVGDLHGDWGSLNKLINKRKPELILQCGDFGWWPKMEVRKMTLYGQQTKWLLQGIKPQGSEIRWCDGNHEDHEDLLSMGLAQRDEVWCYEGVFYQPRGSTYTLDDGRVVLFMGGGDSIDKQWRTPGFDWFPEEIPTTTQLDRALGHKKVDIVISHTCPTEWVPDHTRGEKLQDSTRAYLQYILEKYKPSLWYHGHWHHEREGVSRDTKWFALDYPGHGGRWWTYLE